VYSLSPAHTQAELSSAGGPGFDLTLVLTRPTPIGRVYIHGDLSIVDRPVTRSNFAAKSPRACIYPFPI
jgi:hypothetical protein